MTASDYEYSQDWFSGNIPIWTEIMAKLAPRRYLEIGSWEGRSAVFVAQNAPRGVEIDCIDTWEGSPEHTGAPGLALDIPAAERRFDRNMALAVSRHACRVVKHKSRSAPALARLIAKAAPTYDLIYVDGSHAAPDVLTDCVMAWQLLRVGGIMILDDYLWCQYWLPAAARDPLAAPKIAIDAFTSVFGRSASIVQAPTIDQVYLIKTA